MKKSGWSPLGAKAIREIGQVESDLRSAENLIASTEKAITDWEEQKGNAVARSVRSGSGDALGSEFLKAEANKSKLASYRKHKTSLEARLADLKRPSKERTQQQDRLAQLGAERVQKDGAIVQAIDAVRKLIGERSELTEKMTDTARAIGMNCSCTDETAGAFAKLLRGLPECDFRAESQVWLDWLTGREVKGETKTYTAERDLSLPESLVDPGVVQKGDRIELTEAEALKIVRANPPTGSAFDGFRHALSHEYKPVRAEEFRDPQTPSVGSQPRQMYADPRQLPEYDEGGEVFHSSP